MNSVLDMNTDYLHRISKLSLFDDDFMNIVFQNDKCVQLLLDIILDHDIRIIDKDIQHRLDNIKGRTAIIDMYIADDKGRYIDIEIQREDSQAIGKRAGYHASALKTNVTEKGTEWKEIPEIYIIFITENDVIGEGLPIYHIERRIKENGKKFEDGTHIIYVNGRNEEETRLGRLMRDLKSKDPREMYYKELREEVRYYKEEKEGIEKMCKIFEEVEQRGVKIGKEQGKKEGLIIGQQKGIEINRIVSIKNLMLTMDWNIEEAMAALMIPEEEQEQYVHLIH